MKTASPSMKQKLLIIGCLQGISSLSERGERNEVRDGKKDHRCYVCDFGDHIKYGSL